MELSDHSLSICYELSNDLGMSLELAIDMFILAGGDEELIREASSKSNHLATMKYHIINSRFNELRKLFEMNAVQTSAVNEVETDGNQERQQASQKEINRRPEDLA